MFPAASDRKALDDYLTARLGESARRVASGSVVPDMDRSVFAEGLAGFDFETPRPLAIVLPWVIEQLEHGIVHLTHPRYFGLFNPAPTFPSECAERIVAAFNPQLASSRTSPVAVDMEAHLIGAIARRAGLPPQSVGHFTSGGSEANFTALTCALTRADPRYASEGARGFSNPPVLYVSQDAHSAWHKIAHQSGIGRAAVHVVATDGSGRMDPQALVACIADDVSQGRLPVMIVATAGTTGAGMIDPLSDCAEIARAAGAWLHVDAAWGGALIVSDRLRKLLDGIEAADSVTIDAHKWLATTMACGVFITAHAIVLGEAFHVAPSAASFMPSNIRSLDPYVTTAQWSRRFLGLRLFLSLAVAGWSGYADHVERSIDLTALLREELRHLGWGVANDSSLAVLCVDPPEGFPAAASIAAAVVSSGEAWVAATRFCGRDVLRICLTNGQTMPQDVLALAGILQGMGPASTPDINRA
ncbi:pyridoxal phosphate-dependent decarboxylase family protein [Lichenicoccus sp.]|uniref:pyridoxal phosphate-dependent decarboxylase family protein n=1 Tax=Lichenicoccus sp. TaxID=2781899 RepID=UPI003D0A7F15